MDALDQNPLCVPGPIILALKNNYVCMMETPRRAVWQGQGRTSACEVPLQLPLSHLFFGKYGGRNPSDCVHCQSGAKGEASFILWLEPKLFVSQLPLGPPWQEWVLLYLLQDLISCPLTVPSSWVLTTGMVCSFQPLRI